MKRGMRETQKFVIELYLKLKSLIDGLRHLNLSTKLLFCFSVNVNSQRLSTLHNNNLKINLSKLN